MSFFDLEVLKKKPIKSKGIMPPFKTFKKYVFWNNIFDKKTKFAIHMDI
jgi:hypothetical protein